MSKTPFYKKGIGTPLYSNHDGNIVEKDPRSGELHKMFIYNKEGDRPVSIISNHAGGTTKGGGYMPHEKSYKDAKAGTGIFDESLPSNKPFSGYIRLGDKESTKISGDDLINMSYDDLKKLNVQGFKSSDGSYQNFAGVADKKSFKKFQQTAQEHRKRKDQVSSMRQKLTIYGDEGGQFKEPTKT
tara:strand:+ start:52 stop:606 length:555 start_codon:yes stop_codon:yes gene_type:complete